VADPIAREATSWSNESRRALAAAALGVCAGAFAAGPDTVRLNTFPNAKGAAVSRGYRARHLRQARRRPRALLTENSTAQREGARRGPVHVVHAAVDNAVAMVESARASGDRHRRDNGMNEFFVQPHIASFADLRDESSPSTPRTRPMPSKRRRSAQARAEGGTDYTVVPVGRGELRLKAMAESKDYAAAILNLPFTIQAEQLGMKSLGSTVDMLGPYQANGAFFALAHLVESHGALLERTIAAYVESLRWVRRPENASNAWRSSWPSSRSPATSPSAPTTRSPIRFAASRRTRASTWKGFEISSLCAPRSKARERRLGAPKSYLDLAYYGRALATLEK